MRLQDYKKNYDSLEVKCDLEGEKALEAVRQDGQALRYVKEQTEAICLEAVRQHGEVLRYVNEQTEAICLEAVRQNGYALQYVNKQTENICLEAVKQNGQALRYVNSNMFESKNYSGKVIEIDGIKYELNELK